MAYSWPKMSPGRAAKYWLKKYSQNPAWPAEALTLEFGALKIPGAISLIPFALVFFLATGHITGAMGWGFGTGIMGFVIQIGMTIITTIIVFLGGSQRSTKSDLGFLDLLIVLVAFLPGFFIGGFLCIPAFVVIGVVTAGYAGLLLVIARLIGGKATEGAARDFVGPLIGFVLAFWLIAYVTAAGANWGSSGNFSLTGTDVKLLNQTIDQIQRQQWEATRAAPTETPRYIPPGVWPQEYTGGPVPTPRPSPTVVCPKDTVWTGTRCFGTK
ncbi:MAG: hypothetical protein M1352_01385 [Patescibacteria group bacterium]|nr:hypothetical protein [Patescibacteria group bacterium]